jgi:membrane protease subunit HflK
MRSRFDDDGNPDLKVVVAEYRDAMKKRVRWIGPVFGGIIIALLVWLGTFTVNPGERGVVQTFGAYSALKEPGLHFIVPIMQKYTIVNIEKVRREEIGFRSTQNGPKIVPAEAQMLTGDENIVEVQMIVQYRVAEPEKFLFKLADPEQTLHVAAEVALRDIVGQMRVAKKIERKSPDGKDTVAPDDQVDPEAQKNDLDIMTAGRELAQERVKVLLQKLLKLYESGMIVTVVKLLPVDVPDEVKDAFHDVVRAVEEQEQKINEARAYREDKVPRAKGERQKVLNAAVAYKRKRVAQAEGEAKRFLSVLEEYKSARSVTRKRLHLETMERILHRVPKKVFIDENVAKSTLPFLPIGDGATVPGGAK